MSNTRSAQGRSAAAMAVYSYIHSPQASRYREYIAYSRYSAKNLKPNYLQAVDEYNRGVPLTEPWFKHLFEAFNAYFQQGQAAPGRLTPALGASAIKQWEIDSAPSSRYESISNAMQVVAVGVGLAMVGGAVYGSLSNSSEAANFTAASSSSSFEATGGISQGALAGDATWSPSLASQGLTSYAAPAMDTFGATGGVSAEAMGGSSLTSSLSTLKNVFDEGKKVVTAVKLVKTAISGPIAHSPLAPRPPVTNVPTTASQQPPTIAQSGILPYLAIAALFLL